jgi:hypothetical protein
MTNAGRPRQGFKRIKEFSNPAVGGVDLVGCDVFPDFLQVLRRIDAGNIILHPRLWR